MISGKPVKSSIARTPSPASWSSRAVPPVETSSTSSSARPRAKSTMPRLSDTDSSARRMRTAPAPVGSYAAGGTAAGGSGMPGTIGAGVVACPAAGPGSTTAMEHPQSKAEDRLEQSGDDLEQRLEDLDEQIDEAEHKLEGRREDAGQPVDDVAGDWE